MGYVSLSGGSGDQIRAEDIADYDFAADVDLTIEWWGSVPDVTPAGRGMFLGHNPGAFNSGWSFYLEAAGTVVFRFHDGANKTNTFAAPGLFANTIHHLAITHDFSGNVVNLYVDGVAHGTPVNPGVTAGYTASPERMRIGASGNGVSLLECNVYAAVVSQGVASPAQIAAATMGTPAAGSTPVLDADMQNLTDAEVAAESFVEDSSNAAVMTLAGTEWSFVPDPVVRRVIRSPRYGITRSASR